MKKKKLCFAIVLFIGVLFFSCKKAEAGAENPMENPTLNNSQSEETDAHRIEEGTIETPVSSGELGRYKSKLNQIDLVLKDLSNVDSNFEPKKVNLQLELSELFNPDKFVCIDGKLKEKIKKLKFKLSGNSDTEVNGFIPADIKNNITEESAILLGSGANVLVHSFTYTLNKVESILLVARDAPSFSNFEINDYAIKEDQSYPYLIYTMDCSGYFSAAVTAAAGISGNEIASSANLSSKSESSLILIACLMTTPLYSAYEGNGHLSGGDKATYTKRSAILKSILKRLPTVKDGITINLKENYYVILASNSGKGSFNGLGSVEGKGTAGWGIASFTSGGKNGATVGRSSEFKNYKTYITYENVNSITFPIPIADFMKRIKELDDLVKTAKS